MLYCSKAPFTVVVKGRFSAPVRDDLTRAFLLCDCEAFAGAGFAETLVDFGKLQLQKLAVQP